MKVVRIHAPVPEEIYPLIVQLNPELEFSIFSRYLSEMLSQNYFILGAYDGEKLVGITGCWIATKFYCGKYLEIDNFVIDASYRNQALGSKLMDAVFKEAEHQNCEAVTLNAYIWNEDAHRFYDKFQFETIGKHRIVRIKLLV